MRKNDFKVYTDVVGGYRQIQGIYFEAPNCYACQARCASWQLTPVRLPTPRYAKAALSALRATSSFWIFLLPEGVALATEMSLLLCFRCRLRVLIAERLDLVPEEELARR